MSADFDAYEESDRKMYAEYAHWAEINGRFSHWAKDGTYKHWINNQTRQQDIWDKSEREHDVHKWRMKRWEEREKEDRIQRSKESRYNIVIKIKKEFYHDKYFQDLDHSHQTNDQNYLK